MKCTLMHKRIAVAEIELDDVNCFIRKIVAVFALEHLPVGIPVRRGVPDRAAMNDWWTQRSIPVERSGIREALGTLGIYDTKMLLVRCYGLSLSDQYWICPEDSSFQWEDINFFHNGFSDDIGDVLFGAYKRENILDFSSPDNTSDGNLKKRWKVIEGKCCLVKGGSNPFRQQPFNEVIATKIMERLGIRHVPYTIMWSKGAPYSVCEDFIDENTELIPAWRIFLSQKKSNSISVYQHFVNCCKVLGIRDTVPFLDRMIVLDYIIANEDRHLNNFGAVRNAESLEWLGMAPIYDSGSSLGYDKMPGQIYSEKEIVCKPFKIHHLEQLKLVSSFEWIDFRKLNDVKEMAVEVLSVEGAADYIDEKRICAVADSLQRRIDRLQQFASARRAMQKEPAAENTTKEITTAKEITADIAINTAANTTMDDVEENVAKDYI